MQRDTIEKEILRIFKEQFEIENPGLDENLAEVYDLSSAMELDWYEDIGICKRGEAEKLLNDGDTTLGGRRSLRVPARGIGKTVAIIDIAGQLAGLGSAELRKLPYQLLSLFFERRDGAIDVHDNHSGSFAAILIDRVDARSQKPHTDVEGTPSCRSV